MRTTVKRLLIVIAVAAGAVTAHHHHHHHHRSDENPVSPVPEENGTVGTEESSGRPNPHHHYWLLNRRTNSSEPSEFPDDLFTEEQLRSGAVILHVLGALYSFSMIGIICSDYFLPSVDCICLGLNLSQDVAAATFMSFATTAPELFTVLIGTFITDSDVGLGAVIGSGMFNILGVATFGGLAAIRPIQLDWWPLIRDSSIYLLSLTALVVVIYDRVVTLTKAAFLFSCYFVYFSLMLCNQRFRRLVKVCFKKVTRKSSEKKQSLNGPNEAKPQVIPSIRISSEVPPIMFSEDKPEKPPAGSTKDELDIGSFEDDTSYKAYFINYDRRSLSRRSIKSSRGSFGGRSGSDSDRKESFQGLRAESPENPIAIWSPVCDEPEKTLASLKLPQEMHTLDDDESDEEEFTGVNLTRKPDGSPWEVLLWLLLWPGSFLLYITVPDCRVEKWRKYYPLTFLMCVVWIGVTSYFGNWMISVIGDVIGIPDSVMGLTFLAAGGSMPEAMSTVIMARQGEGGLGFSNSLGGNTMDICLCLGLPWLLKCWLSGPIMFDSESLQYNSFALFIGIFILLGVSVLTKFNMNRKMGLICCLCYLVFIVVSVLLELGVIPS